MHTLSRMLRMAVEIVRSGVNRKGGYSGLMNGAHYGGLRDIERWPNGFPWLLRDL